MKAKMLTHHQINRILYICTVDKKDQRPRPEKLDTEPIRQRPILGKEFREYEHDESWKNFAASIQKTLATPNKHKLMHLDPSFVRWTTYAINIIHSLTIIL